MRTRKFSPLNPEHSTPRPAAPTTSSPTPEIWHQQSVPPTQNNDLPIDIITFKIPDPPTTFHILRSTLSKSLHNFNISSDANMAILPNDDPLVVQIYLQFLELGKLPSPSLAFKVLAKLYVYAADDYEWRNKVLAAVVKKVERGDKYTGTKILPGVEACEVIWESPNSLLARRCIVELWWRYHDAGPSRLPGMGFPDGFVDMLRARWRRDGDREGEGKVELFFEGVIDPQLAIEEVDESDEEEETAVGRVGDIEMELEDGELSEDSNSDATPGTHESILKREMEREQREGREEWENRDQRVVENKDDSYEEL